MTARIRRLLSDFEQVKKDFSGHPYIKVEPVGAEPPERYRVTFFVNGIYLQPGGKVETLARHEVEITLHAEYPRYKPLCKILTPIWHPNFRDGQICIGDIWGAGESLSDIIINIGDMIQYKSWNSYSPLSADAAKWAIENKHLFPVGNLNLYQPDYSAASDEFEIDMLDEVAAIEENGEPQIQDQIAMSFAPDSSVQATGGTALGLSAQTLGVEVTEASVGQTPNIKTSAMPVNPKTEILAGNDFEITADDLKDVVYIPSAQRMQTSSMHGGVVKGKSVNFKTVLVKGILWAFLGAILAFVVQESLGELMGSIRFLRSWGYEEVAAYMEKIESMDDTSDIDDLNELYDLEAQIQISDGEFISVVNMSHNLESSFFAAFIAFGLGLLMGVGEGVFYGSREKALKYAGIGAGIALVIGFVSGYIAQTMYTILLSDEASSFASAFMRGIGWSIMGLGVGLSVGLIKPEKKRMLYCTLGGLGGGFLGGFLFDFVYLVVNFGYQDTGTAARAVGIIIMGLLIGLGIGLLEQFAKQAWLKVTRGEFEGKEYLVFAGTTSIGNSGKNAIVLFKDKLVGPNHCDIILEGNKYVLIDKGTPMGTVVNGMRISRHNLNKGDTIAIGNTVMVFHTK
ncbi:MAG: FHA domain-containing protein [Thermoclostridium sp.]|nr:FHA domain-containing protein [Thermoclostridium sp.]